MRIYCRHDTSPSTRKAHVFPNAFHRNLVTPEPGVECDECNERNGQIDRALILHTAFGHIRRRFVRPH